MKKKYGFFVILGERHRNSSKFGPQRHSIYGPHAHVKKNKKLKHTGHRSTCGPPLKSTQNYIKKNMDVQFWENSPRPN